jgi:hypothetical protein
MWSADGFPAKEEDDMVAEWLAAAAGAGGTALVSAVATDAWKSARAGVLELFGRASTRRQELAADWADETAEAITQASDDERAAVQRQLAGTWQQRLADLVQEHPELADALRAWEAQVRRELPEAQRNWVNTFIARDSAEQYNAPGGHLTVHNYRDGRARP